MKITRAWSMPNSNTFDIKPIKELIKKYAVGYGADAFAKNSKIANLTNDIDPDTSACFHMDALDFIKTLKDESLDYFLFDPPYSPRQISEYYRKLNLSVNMQTTQASFWGKIKNEISKKIKSDGICVTCGWCSNGIGKRNGFEAVEILLVAHGGWHNDTIVTVEQKRINNDRAQN